jgi:hypothetical protein
MKSTFRTITARFQRLLQIPCASSAFNIFIDFDLSEKTSDESIIVLKIFLKQNFRFLLTFYIFQFIFLLDTK